MKTRNHWKLTLLGLWVCVAAIIPSATAAPPDPDNAALLYYQAFLLFPESHNTMSALIRDVVHNQSEPNEAVSVYVTRCANVLGLTRAAADIPACTWGYRYSQGFNTLMPSLAQMRSLTILVLAEARIRAVQGDYQGALENCLLCKQMTQHVGDDTLISFLVSVAMNRVTNQTIRDLLGRMSLSAARLTWLKRQLALVPNQSLSIRNALKVEEQIVLDQMRLDNPAFSEMVLSSLADADRAKRERLQTADEDFYTANRNYYRASMAAVQTILDSSVSYAAQLAELNTLAQRVNTEAQQQPDALLTNILLPSISNILSKEMEMHAGNRALEAGLALLSIHIETGTLPTELPAHLPRDPFSGESFIYETVEEGFVLRCREKDPLQEQAAEFLFKIP